MRICDAVPEIETVTLPSPVVHVPEKVGLVLFDGVATAFKVTTGFVVSTVKLIELLVPLLPAASVWNATAEYEPSASAGDAATENAPATHGADNASVVGPVTASATAPSPVEQLPEMVGVMFDDGVVTAFKVTTGAVVSTVKLTALLVPVFAAASVCDATAE